MYLVNPDQKTNKEKGKEPKERGGQTKEAAAPMQRKCHYEPIVLYAPTISFLVINLLLAFLETSETIILVLNLGVAILNTTYQPDKNTKSTGFD